MLSNLPADIQHVSGGPAAGAGPPQPRGSPTFTHTLPLNNRFLNPEKLCPRLGYILVAPGSFVNPGILGRQRGEPMTQDKKPQCVET